MFSAWVQSGVTLPSGLQTLTFGHEITHSLAGTTLPSCLQTLTFGFLFNQSLTGVTLPSGLQTLTFGLAQPSVRSRFPWTKKACCYCTCNASTRLTSVSSQGKSWKHRYNMIQMYFGHKPIRTRSADVSDEIPACQYVQVQFFPGRRRKKKQDRDPKKRR